MAAPRIAVTGAPGMLGRDVVAAAAARGWAVVALGRGDGDVTDARAIGAAIAAARPDAVVNCAAWTDVDGAEADEAGAHAVNATGAANVAAAAAATGARLVHVSTDYVFDGEKGAPYVEDDPTGPAGAYGRSKLAGEEAVAAACADHVVARTAWLFGAGGGNFVATMLRLGAERDDVAVVTDQIGSPTWTGHLAPALLDLAAGDVRGVVHVAGGGHCSWHDLTVAAYAHAGLRTPVRRTTAAAFPRPARRPAWSALRSTRPGVPRLPAWKSGLHAYLDRRTPLEAAS